MGTLLEVIAYFYRFACKVDGMMPLMRQVSVVKDLPN
jgi:hypothetical protein